MIIFLHVIIAISSIIMGAAGLIRPSRALLNLSYSFISLTVMSGVLVALTAEVKLPQLCLTGLVYLVAMTFVSIGVRYRLAAVAIRSEDIDN